MALSAARVTASTSAVALNTAHPTKPVKLFVTNTSANAADLGAAGVTAGTGFSLPANASASIELDPGDVLFAIRSGGADAVISVLRV
jgi:hypothetical protein